MVWIVVVSSIRHTISWLRVRRSSNVARPYVGCVPHQGAPCYSVCKVLAHRTLGVRFDLCHHHHIIVGWRCQGPWPLPARFDGLSRRAGSNMQPYATIRPS